MGTSDTVFSFDAILINKCTFLPLLTGGFRGNPAAQTRQQRIFGMSGVVPSIHGVKPFGVVYINKSSGVPIYNERSDMIFFSVVRKKSGSVSLYLF